MDAWFILQCCQYWRIPADIIHTASNDTVRNIKDNRRMFLLELCKTLSFQQYNINRKCTDYEICFPRNRKFKVIGKNICTNMNLSHAKDAKKHIKKWNRNGKRRLYQMCLIELRKCCRKHKKSFKQCRNVWYTFAQLLSP